jgi:hypothetical protein
MIITITHIYELFKFGLYVGCIYYTIIKYQKALRRINYLNKGINTLKNIIAEFKKYNNELIEDNKELNDIIDQYKKLITSYKSDLNEYKSIVSSYHENINCSNYNYELCIICLEHIDINSNKKTLECEHSFHKSCINIIENYKCPLCRQISSKI